MQKYQSWENPRCEILKAMAKLKPMSRDICLVCKSGRLLCGRSSCPLLQKIQIQSPLEHNLKREISGPSPPSLFVGWKNYPNVFVGPMASLDTENPQLLDDPSSWYGLDFDDIVRMRSMLIRTKSQQNVREKTKLLEDMQELTLSVKSVDIELKLKSKPRFSMSFSPISQPMGPTAVLENFKIVENPKIPRKVDAIVSDELKAVEGASRLYKKGFDVYYISKVLSCGALGIEKRLVPTRWSITSTDDMLAKEMLKKIRSYPRINEFSVYFNTYLDNHFEILLIPGFWSFEQFEAWAPRTLWTLAYDKPIIAEESEGFSGRSDYAVKEGGGYYAGRFGVAEQLEKMKRQASAIVFREIYDTYIMPVGVWEVRENVRNAFRNPVKKFSGLKEALADIKTRLTLPIEEYLKKSVVLNQRKLPDFIEYK